MKRVTLLVTHLLGSGHLSRVLVLAHAFRNAGMRPQVISGGVAVPHLDADVDEFVQLPPVQSNGALFTDLLDQGGEPASEGLLASRAARAVEALRGFRPDCLITELFPFGRRVLRREFEAVVTAAAELDPRPLIFASVRDILAPPSSASKAEATEVILARHYDGVFVHSDPAVLPLEDSWPLTPRVAGLLHYTGFIAAPRAVDDATTAQGCGEILVTAGGGRVGRRLFETALEAARMDDGRHWRLLVGGSDAATVCARLNDAAHGASARAEPARPDYRLLLTRCAAAVGQCGYNTAIDWLQAGVPGVFVPFAEGGEVEQSIRSAALAARYGYGVVTEQELTAKTLLAATRQAVRHGRFSAAGLKLDGAACTASMLKALLERER
jgi:predicted glycosyltransferase